MGQTGKDLFRLNPLLWEMATQDEYLKPLAAFRKRIAYANAYGTDFPVPAATAAFLSESSAYPHHVTETTQDKTSAGVGTLSSFKQATESSSSSQHGGGDSSESTGMGKATDEKPIVVTTLHTRSVEECEHAKGYYESTSLERKKRMQQQDVDQDDSADDMGADDDDDVMLAQMSTALDSLGWKKVFVDMRKNVPKIAIPRTIPKVLRRGSGTGFFSSSGGSNHSGVDSDSSTEGAKIEESNDLSPFDTDSEVVVTAEAPARQASTIIEPIHQLKPKGILSSKEVAASVLTTALPDDELAFHWPMGHNMIVAFSRSRWSTKMYKAGRPVVDALAKELVSDCLAFEKPAQAEQVLIAQ